ncbi:MAG: tRNA 2-thiouridine(34) synthase MnmA [Dysgonamonadaceae bacterium]|jgi:tRNA-specific 2-thiouridylase|nr:tRNA 2-thiouridine(34) synthase MnmA [Dysgonamonadaceae bacterium]
MNIAALVSGGVDSSVAVYELKQAGYTPEIFYIKIGMEDAGSYVGCNSEEDIEITTFIAKKYGCRMEIVSLHEEYWEKVISYTLDSVRRGLTPNPDMMCNRLIKFGVFSDRWGNSFDRTATGHYATTTVRDGKTCLAAAADKIKDQTYFLAQVDYLQISKLLFPIGHLQKHEVRAIAARESLPSATRKDSQGICFLGKINYRDFLRHYLGEKEGKIVEYETGKTLGAHHGSWFHTVGQRRGLYLSGGPWYVVKKDFDQNTIYVSCGYGSPSQYGTTINLQGFHFITEDVFGELSEPKAITFKIRHTPEFNTGTVSRTGDLYHIQSDVPVHGIAAGQFGVIYDRQSRICIGSGMIISD